MAAVLDVRPARLVVVAGTGTGVGKTWVAAALVGELRRAGVTVAARKPAQSWAPGDGPTDAEVLAAATGEAVDDVCLPARSYEVPMAPFMAAEVLGRPPFRLGDLLAELRWPPGVEVGLVEGAGGVRSPISTDGGDTADLVKSLAPDLVVLVADPGLGTLNSVRLALPPLGPVPTVVLLNRFDPADDLHRRNLAWLRGWLGPSIAIEVDPAVVARRTR